MSANLETMRRWVDAINSHNLSDIDAMIHPAIVDHHLPPGLPTGSAGVAYWCTMLHEALQIHIEIEDAVEQGDRVAMRATVSGYHAADFAGLAATNRSFSVSMMSIERFSDGRVVERWENVDIAAMMQQLAS